MKPTSNLSESDAKQLLAYHSQRGEKPDISNCEFDIITSAKGNPQLTCEHFNEVAKALETVSQTWTSDSSIDREIISYIWDILFLVNERVDDARSRTKFLDKRLNKYHECIDSLSRAVMCMLSGDNVKNAFMAFNEIEMNFD